MKVGERKKKRGGGYLAWKEWLVGLAVDWWWRCLSHVKKSTRHRLTILFVIMCLLDWFVGVAT